jgi:hypothetical protein
MIGFVILVYSGTIAYVGFVAGAKYQTVANLTATAKAKVVGWLTRKGG